MGSSSETKGAKNPRKIQSVHSIDPALPKALPCELGGRGNTSRNFRGPVFVKLLERSETGERVQENLGRNRRDEGCGAQPRHLAQEGATGNRWDPEKEEDEIPNEALRNLTFRLLNNLMTIFNAALCLAYFLCKWKCAIISKVLETLLLARANDHLDEYSLQEDDQFGFGPGHLTALQLYRITDDVATTFNRKQTMVSLGLEKAFDKVRDEGFWLKLKEVDFPSRILSMIRSYFKDRRFHTIYKL
ncbi:hypothetical protein Trydic_g16130 [Trypoxylus dichotomus]